MYRIPDEPKIGRMSHMVVDPILPFMLCLLMNPFLGCVWFVFNGFAMGAYNRYKILNLFIFVGIGLFIFGVAIVAVIFSLELDIEPAFNVLPSYIGAALAFIFYAYQRPYFEIHLALGYPVQKSIPRLIGLLVALVVLIILVLSLIQIILFRPFEGSVPLH